MIRYMKKKTPEAKAKHAKYMREYTRKNKDKINAQRKARRKRVKKDDPEEAERRAEAHRKRCRKYHGKNKDQVNTRAKARNWNYDKEAAKEKRKRFRDRLPSNTVLNARKSKAKRDGLPFNLTKKWYAKQYEKGCAVTGIPFDPPGSRSPWTAHIDRIIPTRGYTRRNSRLVCACFNLAKKNWTDADVLQMAVALVHSADA